MLVGSHILPTGRRDEGVRRTKSIELVGGRCGRHEAHFGSTGWSYRSRGSFLGWHRDSEAGVDPKVSALVYVAARAPDAGEDYGALAAKFPKPPASAGLVESDGYAQLSEEAFVKYFAGDIDPVKARALCAVQGRISSTLFASRTTVVAWKSKPTFYAISKQDKTTSPELERFLADRMKAKTIEIDASHVSLISKPKEIADFILLAAANGA